MSKKDFQNGFALGLASGGVVEIEKEEQEKVVDITENGTTEVTPDEGKALSKVTVNVAIEGSGNEIDWNLVLNKWGSEDYELDDFFYTASKIEGGYGKFAGLQANNLFITNSLSVPSSCFENGSLNLVWFGSEKIQSPNSESFVCFNGAFFGCSNLESVVINSSLAPLEALVLQSDNIFSATPFELGAGYIYVPDDKVEQWQSAIDNFEITNWYYQVEVKPISSAFEEGGPLYGINLDNQ